MVSVAASPATREGVAAWQLRAAWVRRREVSCALVGGDRVRGYVLHVSASGAYALVWDGAGEVHVPCALVLTVRRPHFQEPLDGKPVAPPPPREAIALPSAGQLALAVGDGARPENWDQLVGEDDRRRRDLARRRAEGRRRAVREGRAG